VLDETGSAALRAALSGASPDAPPIPPALLAAAYGLGDVSARGSAVHPLDAAAVGVLLADPGVTPSAADAESLPGPRNLVERLAPSCPAGRALAAAATAGGDVLALGTPAICPAARRKTDPTCLCGVVPPEGAAPRQHGSSLPSLWARRPSTRGGAAARVSGDAAAPAAVVAPVLPNSGAGSGQCDSLLPAPPPVPADSGEADGGWTTGVGMGATPKQKRTPPENILLPHPPSLPGNDDSIDGAIAVHAAAPVEIEEYAAPRGVIRVPLTNARTGAPLVDRHALVPAPCGLVNLGATCYVGAVIQLLCRVRPFRDTLLSLPDDCAAAKDPVVASMRRLLAELRGGGRAAADPRPFIQACSLRTDIQQDGSEFQTTLLHGMAGLGARLQKAARAAVGAPSCGSNGAMLSTAEASALAAAPNLVSDLFRTKLVTRRRCQACGTARDLSETVTDVHLVLAGERPRATVAALPAPEPKMTAALATAGGRGPGGGSRARKGGVKASQAPKTATEALTSVSAALDYYTRAEIPQDYRCEACHSVGATERRTLLECPAPFLMMALGRYAFDSRRGVRRKVGTRVSIPQALDLEPWLAGGGGAAAAEGGGKRGRRYRLEAILVHRGTEAQAGHYVAHVRMDEPGVERGEPRWLRCDDEGVAFLGSHPLGMTVRQTAAVAVSRATLPAGKAREPATPKRGAKRKIAGADVPSPAPVDGAIAESTMPPWRAAALKPPPETLSKDAYLLMYRRLDGGPGCPAAPAPAPIPTRAAPGGLPNSPSDMPWCCYGEEWPTRLPWSAEDQGESCPVPAGAVVTPGPAAGPPERIEAAPAPGAPAPDASARLPPGPLRQEIRAQTSTEAAATARAVAIRDASVAAVAERRAWIRAGLAGRPPSNGAPVQHPRAWVSADWLRAWGDAESLARPPPGGTGGLDLPSGGLLADAVASVRCPHGRLHLDAAVSGRARAVPAGLWARLIAENRGEGARGPAGGVAIAAVPMDRDAPVVSTDELRGTLTALCGDCLRGQIAGADAAAEVGRSREWAEQAARRCLNRTLSGIAPDLDPTAPSAGDKSDARDDLTDGGWLVSRSWTKGWLRRRGASRGADAEPDSPTLGIICPHGGLLPEEGGGSSDATARLLVPTALWRHWATQWEEEGGVTRVWSPSTVTAVNGGGAAPGGAAAAPHLVGFPANKAAQATCCVCFQRRRSAVAAQADDDKRAETNRAMITSAGAEDDETATLAGSLVAPPVTPTGLGASPGRAMVRADDDLRLVPAWWLRAWRHAVAPSNTSERKGPRSFPPPLAPALASLRCEHGGLASRLPSLGDPLSRRAVRGRGGGRRSAVGPPVPTADVRPLIYPPSTDDAGGGEATDSADPPGVISCAELAALLALYPDTDDIDNIGENAMVAASAAVAVRVVLDGKNASLEAVPPTCRVCRARRMRLTLARASRWDQTELVASLVVPPGSKPPAAGDECWGGEGSLPWMGGLRRGEGKGEQEGDADRADVDADFDLPWSPPFTTASAPPSIAARSARRTRRSRAPVTMLVSATDSVSILRWRAAEAFSLPSSRCVRLWVWRGDPREGGAGQAIELSPLQAPSPTVAAAVAAAVSSSNRDGGDPGAEADPRQHDRAAEDRVLGDGCGGLALLPGQRIVVTVDTVALELSGDGAGWEVQDGEDVEAVGFGGTGLVGALGSEE